MSDGPPAVARTREELRRILLDLRPRGPVGFVPTMGALHKGHVSLVRASAAECAVTVASVFVNPTQFGPGEDFGAYPRTGEADMRKLAGAGADVAFLPSPEEIYPEGPRAFIEVEGLSGTLCGSTRPGHFRGVATVVWKLLELVDPDTAYFGAKDAQQVIVIRRMVEDLFGPWSIRTCPTIRERDGLAMSSRNAYLGPEERAAAPVLFRGLTEGRRLLEGGERDAAAITGAVRRVMDREPLVAPEYVELVRLSDLGPVRKAEGDLLLAAAARIGGARLIDNLSLRVGEGVEGILP
ncbi:MAG: pantoate--beta-alanine ligase [Candidatus Eisenbacteria bacterium]